MLLAVELVLAVGTDVPAGAQGVTERVSVSTAGVPGNRGGYDPSISADGRFVAFLSTSTNLVPGDTNDWSDVFVHDRRTGRTERVSVSTAGAQGDFWATTAAISANGRFVAFGSQATNLVPGDTNDGSDVFVRDQQTGRTERVSVSTAGVQGTGQSASRDFGGTAISADGRFVAFESGASNLVPGDTNDAQDIFVRDRQTGRTERVSIGRGGAQSNGFSTGPAISANGRFVAFASNATNLVPGDTNRARDIFVRDRQTGRTERVSVGRGGAQGNGYSFHPAISADGRVIAFVSEATNLVPGDVLGGVFVRDRRAGTTERVSVSTGGGNPGGDGFAPSISPKGRFVAFASTADNLVPGDLNGIRDVFVHDRQTGRTERISVSTADVPGNKASTSPSVSADGRFVAFTSRASNLVPGDVRGGVFVRTR
jgi:Tol biopolymer transport system component